VTAKKSLPWLLRLPTTIHRNHQFQTKSLKKFCSGHQITPGLLACKSRLLFAKIAMAIWFQVSGVRSKKRIT